MNRREIVAGGLGLLALPYAAGGDQTLRSVRRIWDRAPHNAFTDLIRFRDRWFCVFREGAAHVSPDGRLRVIWSDDGERWRPGPVLIQPGADLRDAKINATPDGRLMLSGAAAYPEGGPVRHQTFAWFSSDGFRWSDPAPIGEPDVWLWRVTWHDGTAYGVGYGTAGDRFTRLYSSRDGRRFEVLVPRLHDRGYPNEHSFAFLPDGRCLCLLRRDEGTASGLLGTATAPYTRWEWKDLGLRIGGPHLLRLPDGRLAAAVRLHDGRVRTGVCWLDPDAGRLSEFLSLPSGGDTSYAGLAWHQQELWVSYYSSHEQKTSIYLARLGV